MHPVGPSHASGSHLPPAQTTPFFLSTHCTSPFVLQSAPGFGGFLQATSPTSAATENSVTSVTVGRGFCIECSLHGHAPEISTVQQRSRNAHDAGGRSRKARTA